MKTSINLKRVTTTILAGILALSMLSSCSKATSSSSSSGLKEPTADAPSTESKGDFNKEGLLIVNNVATLRVLIGAEADAPTDLNSIGILADAEKDTNVKIDWVNPGSQGFNEKKSLMLSTGDLPDMIIQGITPADIAMYGNSIFLPMQDLVKEYAPNLTARMEKEPEFKKMATAPDGNLYGVPRVSGGPWGKYGAITTINIGWLKKLNLTMPATLEEYRTVLKAFKTQDPNGNGKADEIGFLCAKGIYGYRDIFYSYGVPISETLLDVTDGKVVSYAADDSFKKAVSYINSLYKDGLIDEESFIIDNSQFNAKMNTEPANVGAAYMWGIPDIITNPQTLADYDHLPLMTSPEGNKPVVGSSAFAWCESGGVITKACKTPEIAMRWIDYWYDTRKSMESIEGKIGDRLIEQPDGTFVIGSTAPDGMNIGAWRANSCLAYKGLWWVSEEDYTTGKNIRIPFTDSKVAFFNKYFEQYAKTEYLPPVMFTSDESAQLSDIKTNYTSLVERKVTEWIRNGQIDKEWDAYVKELDKVGLLKLLQIEQQAYDRYMSVE